MNKPILCAAAALMLSATAAHSAPVSRDNENVEAMTSITTMPLKQMTQDNVYEPDIQGRELSRAVFYDEDYASSPESVEGFWIGKL